MQKSRTLPTIIQKAVVRREHELLTFDSLAVSTSQESCATSVISRDNSRVINGQYARKHEFSNMSAVSPQGFLRKKGDPYTRSFWVRSH